MNIRMSKRYLSSLLILAVVALTGFSASVKISVSPQRGKNQIDVGDIFYLNIVISDINEAPDRPSLPGAKLAYFDRTAQSSNFSSVNGVTTQSYSSTWTATLRAETAGSYTFGPISVGGVQSNSVKYNIGTASSSSNNSSNTISFDDPKDDDSKPKFIGKGDSNLFLKASITESTAYEQQALVYTVKLYTTFDAIKFIGATAAPKFDGFVVEESKDISTTLSYENFQGKTYATAVIARYIIFPQMAGNLKISGNTYTVSVDRREYYHDAFWGNMSFSTPLQLNVTPNDLVINVKPLPSPKPADFSGGVGNFTITSELNGSNFKSNQAASIVYKIKGTGNIKYVQLPDLSALFPPEIEIYTPKSTQDVSIGASNVSGTVSFDYSFMPLEPGEYEIPDVKLVYFNPATGQYETSVAKGYKIKVDKGAENTSTNKKVLRFDSKLQEVDLEQLSSSNIPLVKKFTFWLWFIVPLVVLIIIILIYSRYTSLHSDMIALNSKRADKLARRRLRKAASAMKSGNRERFYDELLRALWGYLGNKLKMPTSELLRDNVRQVLASRGISESTIDMFIKMIDEAEFAKYSSSGGTEDLKTVYEDAVSTINQLEGEFKK